MSGTDEDVLTVSLPRSWLTFIGQVDGVLMAACEHRGGRGQLGVGAGR